MRLKTGMPERLASHVTHLYAQAAVAVTISLGGASGVPSDPVSVNYFLEFTDSLLYGAKARGPNKGICKPTGVCGPRGAWRIKFHFGASEPYGVNLYPLPNIDNALLKWLEF
ncbi:MAG: hypothetical protein MI799_17770 [Desulfobacterales bacterium]|nr:hypothetical protein [Desulfobacterales bacterium]